MQMTQKTLHGMHMAEKLMEFSDIQLILHSGRQSIICILILVASQETLGLVLLWMEWIHLVA